MNSDDAYRRCQALFAEYPLAARLTETTGSEKSMVLMVADSDNAKFFILTQEGEDCSFSLFPWREPGMTLIRPGRGSLAAEDCRVLTRGIPIPRHGSLFGWVSGMSITALISAYTRYTPQTPVPSWAVMPSIDGDRGEWPPFTSRKLLGRWFWEYVRSGIIRDLQSIIALVPETVFWVDTTELIGSGCCVVARDVPATSGQILRKGRYVYYQAVISGAPVPSLDALLRDSSRTDLASRFGAETASPVECL
jgi:hypothetical protein